MLNNVPVMYMGHLRSLQGFNADFFSKPKISLAFVKRLLLSQQCLGIEIVEGFRLGTDMS